jgi:carbamoyltransferase
VRVLGLVCNTHDAGVALVRDGHIEAVLEEERFNRVKRTLAFPDQSLTSLWADGHDPAGIDAIVTPWKAGRLASFFARAVARNFPSSLNLMHARAHPAQRNQILLLRHYLRRGLKPHWGGRRMPKIIDVGHHDAHAATFFVSPFDEAIVLVMDGYGDDASTSAYIGRGNQLTRLWSTEIFNSLGLVYTVVTSHLGFDGFGDEGKVMALAALGSDALVETFRALVRPTPDGRYDLDMSYFSFPVHGQIKPLSERFTALFGPARTPGCALTQHDYDLAHALQTVTEEIVLHLVRGLLSQHATRNLIISGGVALNCVANARVLAQTDVTRLWVPPCASDTGAPLGAALWHTHQTLGRPRAMELTHPFYGRAYSDIDIERALSAASVTAEKLGEAELIARVAGDLAAGRIVGWFQGRFEMGPRALGHRSILADPRKAEMRDTLNARIKKRESFRPFAPAVPLEHAAEFFDISQPDPFMTLAPNVKPAKRAAIAAAVHVDGTGRIQTVEKSANPRYHALLTAFGEITGVPVLINTSFNEHEPIVATPAHAIACFRRTQMDVLVLGDHYVRRA